jgi:2,3-bisphosphoglycerate-dependent phosphoglycerate mutase
MTTTTLFLLRHAESAPSADLPEPEWPLSPTGEEQALSLCDILPTLKIDHIYSSPYPRAVATAAPFAERAGLTVDIAPDLRERKLVEGFVDDWLETLEKSWTDFSFARPNCESSAACQERVDRCIADLVEKHPGETLLLSSHGNAIGLYLNSLDPAYGFAQWRQMRNPDLFRILYREIGPIWDTGFTFSPHGSA